MTERKLASIQRVEALLPITGADRIELAQIGGWNVVVKKGDFKASDLAVYLEIDAVPPDTNRYRWLWQSTKDTDPTPRPGNFRIRTKKLRGALSQGLLMPLEAFGGGLLEDGSAVLKAGVDPDALDTIHVQEGDDITEQLGITKYEPPPQRGSGSNNHARRISNFPAHLVPKTDEERVQNCKRALVELAGKPFIATMKCDGMSATFLYDHVERHEVVACSRNYMVAIEDENVWGRLALKYNLQAALSLPRFRYLAFQAEIVGPSAQGNPLGLAEDDLRVFSVFNTLERKYLTYKEMEKFCGLLGLQLVPVLYSGDSFAPELADLDFTDEEKREENGRKVTTVLQDLLQKAEGKYPGTKNEREGLVIRPRDEELHSHSLRGRLSFKVISNAYLLAEK